MNTQEFQIAVRVIEKAGREHPADAVMREAFKAQRGLSRLSSREISRAVFTYFRWRGWLDLNLPIASQIHAALGLAQQFAESPAAFTDESLANQAVPPWLRDHLEATPAWLRALQSEPRLWLRTKLGKGRELAGRLGDSWVSDNPALADAIEYRGDEDLFRTPEFQAGEFEVQDINSQRVSLVCNPQPGETWWDACAGGGGKTLHLSDLMRNKGLIWASDRAEWRLKRLKLRAARAKCFNYRIVLWDDSARLPTNTKFDGILLDAPCTGVGTWQRNPHARWTTTPEDIAELAAAQLQLLASVAPAVKPEGKLVYAVCTLTREETVKVVEAFTAAHPEFAPLPMTAPGGDGAPAPALTFWPQDTGGSGMFVAAWHRRPT